MALLFNRLHAFEEYPILAQAYFANGAHTLSLRHVNIIRDLTLFYQWLNDPHLITNSRLHEKTGRLITYYRHSLESESRQSFLVENVFTSVCQFDISLINLHELYLRMPTSTGDCILSYVLSDKPDGMVLFKNALRLQLDYFFSFPEPQRIWVSIPTKQAAFHELFLHTGFSLKSEYTSRQQRHLLFYLKKAKYTALLMNKRQT